MSTDRDASHLKMAKLAHCAVGHSAPVCVTLSMFPMNINPVSALGTSWHPGTLPPWHYTFCHHINMGPGMIETTTRQQSEVKLERRFAWMMAGERRRAGVPTDIIPLTRLLIADISVRPRHYCQWTHQRQCCQQQRRRGHCHANTRSISCSCADLVLIQIPSTVTTGSSQGGRYA